MKKNNFKKALLTIFAILFVLLLYVFSLDDNYMALSFLILIAMCIILPRIFRKPK